MEILLVIHSHTRWLILLVAIAAIVKFTIGWLRGSAFKGMDRGLAAGFSGLMDLQATVGIIFLIWTSAVGVPFTPNRIEHLTTMLIASPESGRGVYGISYRRSVGWDQVRAAGRLTARKPVSFNETVVHFLPLGLIGLGMLMAGFAVTVSLTLFVGAAAGAGMFLSGSFWKYGILSNMGIQREIGIRC